MPLLSLPSQAVHYREAGSGPPLVLLHANPGDSLDFAAVMPELARHYRVLALDWPGYGGSELPPPAARVGADYFCQVLREFVAALALPPACFIGNSVGGNAAARLALAAPERVRGLVLVSPGGFTPHNALTRAFCRYMGSRWSLSPRLFAALYLRRRTATTAAMLERAARQQAMPASLAVNRAVWRSFIEPQHDLRAVAGGIRAPTLLLFGRHDPVIPARKDGRLAACSMPSAQFAVMPSGHAPFAEIPEDFLRQVTPFLAGSSHGAR